MNDLQKNLVELTDAERWWLLTWIAGEHPGVVMRGMAHVPREPRHATTIPGEVIDSYYHDGAS